MVLTKHAGKPKKVEDPAGFGQFNSAQLRQPSAFVNLEEESVEDFEEGQDENMFDI